MNLFGKYTTSEGLTKEKWDAWMVRMMNYTDSVPMPKPKKPKKK